jgi:Ni/Co efflux regulator RcnB
MNRPLGTLANRPGHRIGSRCGLSTTAAASCVWPGAPSRFHPHPSREPNMNNKVVLAAIMAMSLPLTDAAFGQGGAPGNPPGRDAPGPVGEQGRQTPPQGQGPPGQGRQAPPSQRDQMKPPAPGASRDRQPPPPRGAEDARGPGPSRAFQRGERLPSRYRHEVNVVHDWRGQHLRPPPRGYHWVRTGPDFALVAISSGVISRIVLSR